MAVVAEKPLKAPFPAFGGKSRAAHLVWERLGPVRNFIEPFCFTAAVLLLRPDAPKIETINDLNSYVANFWRAVRADPEAVAAYADWPVNETDMHARHRWLVLSDQASSALDRVRDDPDAYDAKIAGWWCWGASMWIGSGWCESRGAGWTQVPRMGDAGQGVHKDPVGQKRDKLTGNGVGCGVHSTGPSLGMKRPRSHRENSGVESGLPGVHGRPQLADQYTRGRGVHANDSLTDCDRRRGWLTDWFGRLSDRLRPVRVCCGHWMRVCDSDSTLSRLGLTGVFLDPPYRKTLADGTENRAGHLYANDKTQDVNALCDEVQAWCLKWGGDPLIRVALCGLEGEYPALAPAGWEVVPWKSPGGYGNRSDKGKANAARERIWFSPNCLKPGAGELLFPFAG